MGHYTDGTHSTHNRGDYAQRCHCQDDAVGPAHGLAHELHGDAFSEERWKLSTIRCQNSGFAGQTGEDVRCQAGEQIVGKVASRISGHANDEADSNEEPKSFGGQHVRTGRLE